jgi:glycosyl transferase family 25
MIRFFIKISLECIIIYTRWITKSIIKNSSNNKHNYVGLENCEIYYINLDHRVDRKNNMEKEFSKLNINNSERFSAIKNSNGALGCSISHKSIYQKVKNKNKPVLICEDDALFLTSRTHIDNIIIEFLKDSRLDVLCLAYNDLFKIRVNRHFFITSNTQTMSCYLLKPYVINDFIEMADTSISGLSENKPEEYFAIDMVWKNLQRSYIFALPYTRFVVQKPSYSDIRKTEVNYNI